MGTAYCAFPFPLRFDWRGTERIVCSHPSSAFESWWQILFESGIRFKWQDPVSSIILHPLHLLRFPYVSVYCQIPRVHDLGSVPPLPTRGLKEQRMTKVPKVPFRVSKVRKAGRNLWGKFSLVFLKKLRLFKVLRFNWELNSWGGTRNGDL